MTERTLFEEQITGVEASEENIPADYEQRDEILSRSLHYLNSHGGYISFDVAEEINYSYAVDTLEEFRQALRDAMRELA